MHKKLIIGNWKMNLSIKESLEMAKALAGTNFPSTVDVAVCPTFVSLAPVSVLLEKTNIKLGAQDVSWAELGKYTGEVSADELKELGVQYVLVGHSERRRYQNEDDHLINKKMLHLVNTDLVAVLCVGEDYGTRQKGDSNKCVNQQLTKDLLGVHIKSPEQLVIAYEPVWAIGTGRVATPSVIADMHLYIRHWLMQRYGGKVGMAVRIIYGGSVSSENCESIINNLPEVAGALSATASLKFSEFSKIIHLVN
jgi:triosephosphate isomerase